MVAPHVNYNQPHRPSFLSNSPLVLVNVENHYGQKIAEFPPFPSEAGILIIIGLQMEE